MPCTHTRTTKGVNPQHKDMISKLMGSMSEVKRLELSTKDNITKLIADKNSDLVDDLTAEVKTVFQIDHDLKSVLKYIEPRTDGSFDKRKINTLPPYAENTVSRVVVVSGSNEIFTPAKMSSLPFNAGVFVSAGSAFKTSPTHGDFTYDNRGMYDAKEYPGRGIKRPEHRRLVIIDFVGETTELAESAKQEELLNIGKKITGDVANSELISELASSFGIKPPA